MTWESLSGGMETALQKAETERRGAYLGSRVLKPSAGSWANDQQDEPFRAPTRSSAFSLLRGRVWPSRRERALGTTARARARRQGARLLARLQRSERSLLAERRTQHRRRWSREHGYGER